MNVIKVGPAGRKTCQLRESRNMYCTHGSARIMTEVVRKLTEPMREGPEKRGSAGEVLLGLHLREGV